MTPEQQSRLEIDRQLEQCGWVVQSFREMNITAGLGVAVREFPLKSGFADYLLYADGKAVGVIEAKPEGHTLTGVETQSSKYADGLPNGLPNYRLPLPFAYESTGSETRSYQRPGAERSQPSGLHLPSAGRVDSSRHAGSTSAWVAAADAAAQHAATLAGPGGKHSEP